MAYPLVAFLSWLVTDFGAMSRPYQLFIWRARSTDLCLRHWKQWAWLITVTKAVHSVDGLFTENRNVWPLEIPQDWTNTRAFRSGQSPWAEGPTHRADIKHFCHGYKTGLLLDFFKETINHLQKDKFVSAPMIIIGSIPKSSNLYLLHWKIHMGLRLIIYAQIFSSFDFSFDTTSWFKAWCTINFLQMCSNSWVQSKVMIHLYWSDSIIPGCQNPLKLFNVFCLFLEPIET